MTKKKKPPSRTTHKHVVDKDNPSPAPNQSVAAGGVVTGKKPQPAPNQSVPAAPVVDKKNPVAAPAQSTPVGN